MSNLKGKEIKPKSWSKVVLRQTAEKRECWLNIAVHIAKVSYIYIYIDMCMCVCMYIHYSRCIKAFAAIAGFLLGFLDLFIFSRFI